MDYIPLKDHVDLSAEMGWKYSLVDADWDIMKNGNIDQLIEYAHSQGVELFIWYNSGGPNNRVMWYFNLTDDIANRLLREGIPSQVMNKLKPIVNVGFFPEEEYYDKLRELLGDTHFDAFGEKIFLAARNRNARPRDRFYEDDIREIEFRELKAKGVRGLKLDFFASDKQEIIKMYINIFREAARNQILINTHGSTIPRGWSKTFPNLLTMQGRLFRRWTGTGRSARDVQVSVAMRRFTGIWGTVRRLKAHRSNTCTGNQGFTASSWDQRWGTNSTSYLLPS
jgi:hypothetical protein